jgi:hypothetical protein
MAEPAWRRRDADASSESRLIAGALQAGAAPLIALTGATGLRVFNELKRGLKA